MYLSMGLGKTLEIIALIITDMERFNLKHRDQRATLIVAPVSVMSNWSGQVGIASPLFYALTGG